MGNVWWLINLSIKHNKFSFTLYLVYYVLFYLYIYICVCVLLILILFILNTLENIHYYFWDYIYIYYFISYISSIFFICIIFIFMCCQLYIYIYICSYIYIYMTYLIYMYMALKRACGLFAKRLRDSRSTQICNVLDTLTQLGPEKRRFPMAVCLLQHITRSIMSGKCIYIYNIYTFICFWSSFPMASPILPM